jgi:hypothetical protein
MKFGIISAGLIALSASAVLCGDAAAQGAVRTTTSTSTAAWVPMPKTWTTPGGMRVLEYSAAPSGAGCKGMSLRNVPNRTYGTRAFLIWPTATKQDGGIVCSSGYWDVTMMDHKYTGAEPDVLIKGRTLYNRKGACSSDWCK